MTRYFVWPVNAVLVGALAALAACGATDYARTKMRAADDRRAVCAAELKAMRARNPYIERFLTPADPCLALQVVTR